MPSFLTSSAGLRPAGIVGVALIAAWAINAAYQAGKDAERLSRLKSDIEAYQKREGIENEVGGMDRVRICLELGGMQSDCEQLLRVEEAAAGE